MSSYTPILFSPAIIAESFKRSSDTLVITKLDASTRKKGAQVDYMKASIKSRVALKNGALVDIVDDHERPFNVSVRNLVVHAMHIPTDDNGEQKDDASHIKIDINLADSGKEFMNMQLALENNFEKCYLKENIKPAKKEVSPFIIRKYSDEPTCNEKYRGKDRPFPISKLRVEFGTFGVKSEKNPNPNRKCVIYNVEDPIKEADGSIKRDGYGVPEKCNEIQFDISNVKDLFRKGAVIVKGQLDNNSVILHKSGYGLIQTFRKIYLRLSTGSSEAEEQDYHPDIKKEAEESADVDTSDGNTTEAVPDISDDALVAAMNAVAVTTTATTATSVETTASASTAPVVTKPARKGK